MEFNHNVLLYFILGYEPEINFCIIFSKCRINKDSTNVIDTYVYFKRYLSVLIIVDNFI